MVKNNNEFTISELVYYAYFALMLFVKGVGLYEGQWPYTLSLLLGAVLIIVKLLVTEHTITEWIFIVLMSTLAITIYFHSHKLGILIITATIIGMKGVSVKRVMWIGTVIWSLTFIANILLVLLGIRPDILRVQEKLGLGYIIRYSLGSTHPNVLQISYMILCAFILYVAQFKGKKLVIATGVMILGSFYVFMYSVSYTGIVLCIFYLLLNLYLSFRKKLWLLEKGIALAVFPFCVWLTIYVFNHIDFPYYYYINKYLNTRPYITLNYMAHTPVTAFGSGYNANLPVTSNNLDSSFVYALMHYGWVFFGLFIVSYIALIVNTIKKNDRIQLGMIIAFALAAISEPFFVNESFKNISWIFMGAFIYELIAKIPSKSLDIISGNSLIWIGNTHIYFSFDGIIEKYRKFIDICKQKRKTLFVLSFILVLILGTGFYFLRDIKSTYYVNRSIVQTEDKEYTTIDINKWDETIDGSVINYVDAQTPMVLIEGNIGIVEYYRELISFVLWISLSVVAVYVFIIYRNE